MVHTLSTFRPLPLPQSILKSYTYAYQICRCKQTCILKQIFVSLWMTSKVRDMLYAVRCKAVRSLQVGTQRQNMQIW